MPGQKSNRLKTDVFVSVFVQRLHLLVMLRRLFRRRSTIEDLGTSIQGARVTITVEGAEFRTTRTLKAELNGVYEMNDRARSLIVPLRDWDGEEVLYVSVSLTLNFLYYILKTRHCNLVPTQRTAPGNYIIFSRDRYTHSRLPSYWELRAIRCEHRVR